MPARLGSSLRQSDLRLSPLEVARGLSQRPGFFWGDSATEDDGHVSVLTCDPVATLSGDRDDWDRLRGALEHLRRTLDGGPREHDLGLPGPGLFGSIDFDGQWHFGVYPEILVYHHGSDQWWTHGDLAARIDPSRVRAAATGLPPLDFQPLWTRDGFLAAVAQALAYIRNGDIYQVNLAQPWRSHWPNDLDLFSFYQRLRSFSPAPQSAFYRLGGRQVASASPELFLRISGRTIRTRPIKGTRPRHRSAQEDERAAYDLITSPKEVSELIMITDLERNDLGQVCEFGSVSVPDMLRLERYEQVFHLVSTVEGTLRPDIDHLAAVRACLPGGSISGAPKCRALEIIDELEPFPRGLYTGVIGWFGVNSESQFSIAIRTAIAEADSLHFHAGAGIVADSDPVREYEETWQKASTLLGVATWPG